MYSFEFDSAKKIFIEKMKIRLSKQFLLVKKNIFIITNPIWLEECYFLLKQIRDTSAIFKMDAPFQIAHFLLKKIKPIDLTFMINDEDSKIFIEGLKKLVQWFFNELGQSEKRSSYEDEQGNSKKKGIVIVDHDELFVEWLKESFLHSEFEILSAENDYLIQSMMNRPVVLLLINMMLPNRKAFQILSNLKTNGTQYPFPILAMTHSINNRHIHEIINCGVHDIIQKPFTFPLLEFKIEKLINGSIPLNTSIKSQKDKMIKILLKEWDRFTRFHSYFSIVLLNVTFNEKQINFLTPNMINLYQIAIASIRQYDEISIWSNNSILIMLPAAKRNEAVLVGERIRKIWEENNFCECKMVMAVLESEHGYENMEEMIRRIEKEVEKSFINDRVIEIPYLTKKVEEQKKLKILIIDNDPVTGSIIMNSLNPDEWEIEICIDGRKAMDRTLTFQPNIIICETRILYLDGFLFCSQIRNIPSMNEVIFIFMSKQHLSHHISRAFKVGADDYVVKPFSMKELEARLKRFKNFPLQERE